MRARRLTDYINLFTEDVDGRPIKAEFSWGVSGGMNTWRFTNRPSVSNR